MKKRLVSIGLAAAMAVGLLSGCGSQSTSGTTSQVVGASSSQSGDTSTNSKYPKELTIDVFDSEANYQGVQSGWFAKIVKDKFNMKLNIVAPNVAGGGDTLFQTRSAAGNLGDLIICNTSNGKLSQLVKAGLVQDISPYLKNETNVTAYQSAIDSMKDLAGTDNGIYAIPSEVSKNAPTDASVGLEPNYGPYIRWDYYKAIGYPEIKNLDDLLDVLTKMQAEARKEEGSNDIYALSLFKDWDRNMMTLARNITCMYGYDQSGIALLANDDSDIQDPIGDDSIYYKALKFLYKANKAGLVDPDSTTQNYDTMYQKMQSGKCLFSFWSWMGQGAFNTPDHTAAGKGFKMAPVEDMKIGVNGCRMNGNHEIAIMVGSKAEDPQRLVDFIDWLYSPEGIMADQANGTSGSCGPEGLTWEESDGQPALTDFGKKALGGDDVDVPSEWGGGKWQEGVSTLNVTFVNTTDVNPLNNEPYMYTLWDSTMKDNETALDKDWEQQTGAKSAIDYLKQHNMLDVAPGDSYVTPEEDSTITNLRSQCGSSLTEYSWKLAFADSDSDFDELYSTMQSTLKGLNYSTLFDNDKKQAEEKVKAREEVVAEYNKTQSQSTAS